MTTRATFESDTLKVQAEATSIVVKWDGVECRVWNAVTETGDQVFLFIHRVATREELKELMARDGPKELI